MGSPTHKLASRRWNAAMQTRAITIGCGVIFFMLVVFNATSFTTMSPPKHPIFNSQVSKSTNNQPKDESTTTTTTAVVTEVGAEPSVEDWPMKDQFYTSTFPDDDTSTTIIFNLFKGPAEALRIQLEAATKQQHVALPEIWVMCFNSPMQKEYEAVVNSFKNDPAVKNKIVLTVSDFNHKFHGRFLLAYMAKTKYVLIIDDDKNIDETTVADYITHMKMQRGVWGNFGHLRAPTFDGYKSWPNVGYNVAEVAYAEMDYLSGMWFVEQSWLEYFVKERMPSWETSEDMHLSHVMRKYLNLNTYGGKVAMSPRGLPSKKHAATVGKALDLREYIFDHQLGRGNKVANVDQPIDTLVYAETVEDILTIIKKIEACKESQGTLREGDDPNVEAGPWCNVGKTAAVFRGSKEQDVVGLITAAKQLCDVTACEYVSLKPKIKHPIRYFNMREGYGQADTEIPWQTGAADVLTSFVGILNNILPKKVFLPDVSEVQWAEDTTSELPRKKNRLQIYHDTLQLAINIHLNSPTNQKWKHRERERDETTAYPSDMEVYTWKHVD